jgi:hypothetical protein
MRPPHHRREPKVVVTLQRAGRIAQRPLVITHPPLPFLPAVTPDAPDVLVPRVRRAGRVPVLVDDGVPPRRDHRGRPAAVQHVVHRPLVVRPVRLQRPDFTRDVIHQPGDGGRVRDVVPRRLTRDHLVRPGVDRQVQLPPRPPLGIPVLADLPLPLPVHLQAGAVHQDDPRPGRCGGPEIDRQAGGPAGQGGVMRDGNSHAQGVKDGGGEPLGGAERQVVHLTQREDQFDGRVAGHERPADLLRILLTHPIRQGVLVDPDGQRSPLDQGAVVGRPVADFQAGGGGHASISPGSCGPGRYYSSVEALASSNATTPPTDTCSDRVSTPAGRPKPAAPTRS